MPRFSIVTVCRNERDGIHATCKSVRAQTLRDFEWIVIDGASTDGTLEVLEAHREQIDVLVSEPDGGIYQAMNKGLARARGQAVVFLNGGDRFADPEVLAAVAGAPAADLVYGDLRLPDGAVIRYPDRLDPDYLRRKMIPHQASFVRRELVDELGGFDESFRIAGDYDFFVRLVRVRGCSSHHVSRVLAEFAAGGVSMDRERRALRKRENHRVRWTYFPRYRWSLKALRQEFRNRLQSES